MSESWADQALATAKAMKKHDAEVRRAVLDEAATTIRSMTATTHEEIATRGYWRAQEDAVAAIEALKGEA